MLNNIGLSHNPVIQSVFRMKGSRNSVIHTTSCRYILSHCKFILSKIFEADLPILLSGSCLMKKNSDYLGNGEYSEYLINGESFKPGGKVGIQVKKL